MNSEDRKAKAWSAYAQSIRSGLEPKAALDAALEAAGLNELVDCSQSVKDVAAERLRQVSGEGWTPEHDDSHSAGQMAVAAACYALALSAEDYEPSVWPWDSAWWKPRSPRENLVRAGALILAEIDRIDRAALTGDKSNG